MRSRNSKKYLFERSDMTVKKTQTTPAALFKKYLIGQIDTNEPLRLRT